MNKIKIASVLFAVLLSVVLLFTAVELVTFNMSHYLTSYQRHGVPADTGMDLENLAHVTQEIIDYLRGRQDVLNPQAVVDGELQYVFGEREQLHMIDVLDLFRGVHWIRNISLLVMLPLGFWLFRNKEWKQRLFKTILNAVFITLGVIAILLLLMLIDFNQAFTWFHLLLFDNDLWLLPKSSIMIRMLPEVFFFETALKILGIYVTSLASLSIGSYLIAKFDSRKVK